MNSPRNHSGSSLLRTTGTAAPAGFRAPARGRRAGLVPAVVCAVAAVLALTAALGAASAAAAPPAVTIEDASSPSYLSAQVKGTVDPGEAPTAYRFQYATQADFSDAVTGIGVLELEGTGAQTVQGELTGLAPNTTYHLRLLAENAESPPGVPAEAVAPDTFTTLAVQAPTLTIADAGAITATGAEASGTVELAQNDPAFNSSCAFEYATAEDFSNATALPCEPGAGTILASEAQPVAVSADLTGLIPHTTYHLRLVASNAGGTSEAIAAETLITKVQIPLIEDTSAANVTSNSADLRALINPGGGATTYHFDYGPTAAYGQSTPESGSIGSDNSEHQAAAHITGLEPETTYHFRVVATNSASPGGGTLGPDRTFTTQPASSSVVLPDGRQWELVSPPDKHGAEVENNLFFVGGIMQAAEDGSAVTYITNAPIDGTSQSNPLENQILSRRGPGGWSSQDIATPHAGGGGREYLESGGGSLPRLNESAEYWAFSPDLSLAYVEPEATTPLAPPAPAPKQQGVNGYDSGYVRDNNAGTYSITKQNSKEWYDEQVAFSQPPKCDGATSPVGATVGTEGVQAVSQDGCYVYFNSTAGAGPLEVAHYDGTAWTTTLISGLLGPGAIRWGEGGFAELSPNGRYLTFMSNQSLTGYDNTDANSPVGEPRIDQEVFLYDAATDSLTCPSCDPTGARPLGQFDTSTDTNSTSPGVLRVDPAHSFDGAWLAGLLAPFPITVQSTSFTTEPLYNHQPRYLTDSGELFFESPVALVPRDVNGTWDVYEYRPQGVGGCAEASGCPALISSGRSSDDSVLIEASTDGSDVFFFTSERLSGQDFDHVNDVYDAHVCSAEVPCPPPSPPPAPACEGDACQQPAVPPNHPTPASRSYSGPENEHPAKAKKLKKHHRKQHHGTKHKKAHNKRIPNHNRGGQK
jgi:hypothetical protein